MKCPNCGSEVGMQDKFCGSCGSLLQQQNIDLIQPPDRMEKRSKGLSRVIFFLGAAACVMAVVVLFLFFGQEKTLQKESETVQLNTKNSSTEAAETPGVAESTEKKTKDSTTKETPYWKNYCVVSESQKK